MEITLKRRERSALAPLPDIKPILQKIYQARGIQTHDDIARNLQGLLPFNSLLGIDKAVVLLSEALRLNKRILIIGDFDADGATSSTLAMLALKRFGAQQVDYLIPNRFEYGYGLTPEIVEVARAKQPDLIITVDNGISSVQGVAVAKALGWQVLVTDHHLAGSELPAADAIINPNQPGDLFPSKNLAGVGVIFYVMLALRAYLKDQTWFQLGAINLAEFLDLVALGTVADVVPLDKNNRILVHQGLQRIRAGQCRPGIRVLLELANRRIGALSASDLSFGVGPRLNAAGRLDDMSIGIECLLTDNIDKARQLAQQLETFNQERRELESEMKTQAFSELERLGIHKADSALPSGLCIFDESWHQGVIGIVAGRVKDRFHRPVIAFANASDTELKGSARSIPGLHIRDALDAIATQNPGLISKFGGHAMAAGLTLERAAYPQFCAAFAKEVELRVTPEQLQGYVLSDGELESHELNMGVAELLRESGPWGQAFPEPLFDGIFEVVQQRLLAGKHLKLMVKIPGLAQPLAAIAFNVDLKLWPQQHCTRVHLGYRLDINEYNGLRQVQLLVEYLKAA